MNQKAVDAHAQSDFKAARALLQDADKLALASGYAEAPVRAQTQVRLGALYVAQKNPRVGRRYLAKAVAINPAVRIPPGMMSPQARKVLIATKQKARLAKNGPPKRAPKSHPPRRHGRDLTRMPGRVELRQAPTTNQQARVESVLGSRRRCPPGH